MSTLVDSSAPTVRANPSGSLPAADCAVLHYHYFWLVRTVPLTAALCLLLLLARADMTALTLQIQHVTNYLPDRFWSSVTLLGHGSVLLAFAALAWKKRPDWIIAGVCGGIVAGLYSRLLKGWIGGPRPAGLIPEEHLHVIGERLLNGSFPSGHTATAFLLAGVIFLSGRVPPRIAAIALIAALLIGLSRIAVGAHWPVDVIAGAAGGWLSAALGIALARRLRWLQTTQARLSLAVIILISSAALPFASTGHPLALPLQYLSAGLGFLVAGRWARAEWNSLR